MKVKAKDPKAVYSLKNFWPGDLNKKIKKRKRKKGRTCLYTINLFVKFNTFLGGVEEEENGKKSDFGEMYLHCRKYLNLFWYCILSAVNSSQWVF